MHTPTHGRLFSEHSQNSSTVFVNNNDVDGTLLYDNIPNTCQEVTSAIVSRDLVIRTDLSEPHLEVTVQWLAVDWDCSHTAKSHYMIYHNKEKMTSVNPFVGRFTLCAFYKQLLHDEGVSSCIFHCACLDGCSSILMRIRSPLVGIKLCEVHLSAGRYV